MVGEEKIGQLEDQALKRKARLQALRQKQGTTEIEPPPASIRSLQEEVNIPRPVFRSYVPQDDMLKENTLPVAKPESVEKELAVATVPPSNLVQDIDLASLAPRKPDWDLKRDAAKKLQRLERRTQKAIAELIRDRLQADQSDLAQVITSGAPAQPDSDED